MRQHSLRLRIGMWSLIVIVATIFAFTALDLMYQRQQILRLESAHAEALLAHLSGMVDLRTSFSAAHEHIQRVGIYYHPLGIELLLAKRGSLFSMPGYRLLAERPLNVGGEPFVLRFAVSSARLAGLAREAVMIHAIHAGVAVVALVLGIEIILRRRLVRPMKSISHQVKRLRAGFGWELELPGVDEELEGLRSAVAGIGPELEQQFQQQVSTIERSVSALTANRLEHAVRDRIRDCFVHLGDIQARDLVRTEGKERLRAVVRNLEEIATILQASDFERDGHDAVAEGGDAV